MEQAEGESTQAADAGEGDAETVPPEDIGDQSSPKEEDLHKKMSKLKTEMRLILNTGHKI